MPVLGPALMATCRGASVLLGSAAFLDASGVEWGRVALALVAACATWVYIFCVTIIAASETKNEPLKGMTPFLSPAILGLAVALGLGALRLTPPPVSLFILALVLGETAFDGWKVRSGSIPVPAYIGRLLRKLIFLQGAWLCWAANGEPFIVIAGLLGCVLVMRIGAELASRKFYGS